MTEMDLPLWVEIGGALLLVCGGLLTALGSFGLLRLPDFFSRMHSPAMGTTLGTGCILLTSILVSSVSLARPILHELLIALFVAMTAPVTAMLLARAAIYRGGRHHAKPIADAQRESAAANRQE
jgi:multicomponent K+:H+ antiporter subunit G